MKTWVVVVLVMAALLVAVMAEHRKELAEKADVEGYGGGGHKMEPHKKGGKGDGHPHVDDQKYYGHGGGYGYGRGGGYGYGHGGGYGYGHGGGGGGGYGHGGYGHGGYGHGGYGHGGYGGGGGGGHGPHA